VLQEDALRAAGCSRIWLDTASGPHLIVTIGELQPMAAVTR